MAFTSSNSMKYKHTINSVSHVYKGEAYTSLHTLVLSLFLINGLGRQITQAVRAYEKTKLPTAFSKTSMCLKSLTL